MVNSWERKGPFPMLSQIYSPSADPVSNSALHPDGGGYRWMVAKALWHAATECLV